MAKKNAAWTVMVYLAGDNNLSTECMFALTEMKQANIGKHVNVIAQFDPSDPHLPTHRYVIQKRGKNKGFRHDIIDQACYFDDGEIKFGKESACAQTLAADRKRERDLRLATWSEAYLTGSPQREPLNIYDTDSGSPVTLYNFISFCLQEYPADHYIVVLSGHAAGTERDYLMKDESSACSLTFNEMKRVFERVRKDLGRPLDIVGMDTCLMSMAEICYELRGSAEIVVGCESFSPASGWPYREVLERLADDFVNPRLQPEESVVEAAAKAIVKEYVNYYSNYWIAGLSVTQSALNVCKVEKLHEVINELAGRMEKQLIAEANAIPPNGGGRQFQDALLLAHWEAQSYNGEQFVDLFDFCDCLQTRLGEGAIAEQCQVVKDFLESEFVLASCYSGAIYQYSYGVSLYFPWSYVALSYWNLDFVKEAQGSGWGSFLKTYTLLTRRTPRGMDAKSKLAQALNDRIANSLSSEPVDDEHKSLYRMGIDRMGIDRTNTGAARNYIHSMRNPPNVFFPDECIRKRKSALLTQEMLRLR